MKYAIIENEEFARENLQEIISELRPTYKCAFCAETIKDAVEYFSINKDISLVFMDVELDDGNCFEIFKRLELNIPVVFTTAYDEYAIKAFKVNSVDYLLKPISEEDVALAIKSFERYSNTLPNYHSLQQDMSARYCKRILVSLADSYSYVRVDEVAWVEAGDKYVSIVKTDGTSRITEFTSLAEVENILDPDRFFRISRSVIASIDAIIKVNKYFKGRLRVEIKSGGTSRTETVTATRRDEFLEWMGHS